MKQPAIQLSVFLLTTIFVGGAALAQPDRDLGYRNCNLHNLSACQDSNQLFFGPPDGLHYARKNEFANAISHFLSGAPPLYLDRHAFRVSDAAEDSLVGPGDHHDHLSSGDWFFDGFTPHDAPDKGAVLFKPDGEIVAIAILDVSTDDPTPKINLGQYVLRIYSHDTDPPIDLLELLHQWGKSAVNPKSDYPGALPDNDLVATHIYSRVENHWVSKLLQ